MGKPFQFSIRRLLAAMALCCVGVGLFCSAIRSNPSPVLGIAIVIGSGVLVGGGLGILIRSPITCAICGGVLAILAYAAFAVHWFLFVYPFEPWFR